MTTYVNEGGVENVAVGIIKQAKKDFIKGAKVLYKMFGRIPTEEEFFKSPKRNSRTESIRWTYNAWRFVHEDPYQFFDDEGAVINAWKREAIEQYYKELYLKGAEILFRKHVPKQDIKENDEAIMKAIEDKQIAEDFIAARNYIFSLPGGEETLKEWNVIAYGRARHYGKGRGKVSIQNTKYHKERSKKRIENIKKAKEMYEEGMSTREIATELEVSIQAARTYVREAHS